MQRIDSTLFLFVFPLIYPGLLSQLRLFVTATNDFTCYLFFFRHDDLRLLDAYWPEMFFFSSASICVVVLCAFKLNKNSEWGGKVWFFSSSLSFFSPLLLLLLLLLRILQRRRRRRLLLLLLVAVTVDVAPLFSLFSLSFTHKCKRFFQTSQRV